MIDEPGIKSHYNFRGVIRLTLYISKNTLRSEIWEIFNVGGAP